MTLDLDDQWQNAACAEKDPDMFAAPREIRSNFWSDKEAKAFCIAECAVRQECLKFALENPSSAGIGIWGGTSERDRKRMLKDGDYN